jgi:hypothetical protein
VEVALVRAQRDLVLRAAIDEVEQCTGQPAPSQFTEVFDVGDDRNSSIIHRRVSPLHALSLSFDTS